MARILVVDNYDSFVYTIVGYLAQLGAETVVVRNDAVPPSAERAGFDGVLVSPGPGTPAEAGASLQVIRDCAATGTPMLGVCLGHQALG
ncbi:MAG TPA: aminodeoxychorismate/anthranilate synthase component II, partial [Cellulomonas sp.]